MATFVFRTAKSALAQNLVVQERVVGAVLGALAIADVRTEFLFTFMFVLMSEMFPG
jgi:hypothetical protein